MIKRIISLFQQDLTNALRDNLVLYLIVAPLLLAVGARLFVPSLQEIKLTFAVERQVEQRVIDELARFGQVELYDSATAVQARVEMLDDVPGIIRRDGEYVVLLEGNEPDSLPVVNAIMTAVLVQPGAPTIAIEQQQLSNDGSLLPEYTAMTLIMLATLLGALAAAFIIVDDKETGAIRALAVAPLRLVEYTLARAFFALALSFILVMGSSLIMLGTAVNYSLLLAGFLGSAGLIILVTYLVGGFADNQLSAVAIIKLLMAAYISLPVISIFIPQAWHWLFYPLPNYWFWTSLETVFIGQTGPVGFWGATGLMLAISLVGLAVIMPLVQRRLKFR
jgi:ABC-2 type transport system permease protein